MKVQLRISKQYSTQDKDNKDVVVRTIEAEREIEVSIDFLPTCFRIGEQDFFTERNLYDVDTGRWVCNVGFERSHAFHDADRQVELLKASNWFIRKDEKNLKVVSFSLGREDAVALVEAATEGLKARGIHVGRHCWSATWSEYDLELAVRHICRKAAEAAN